MEHINTELCAATHKCFKCQCGQVKRIMLLISEPLEKVCNCFLDCSQRNEGNHKENNRREKDELKPGPSRSLQKGLSFQVECHPRLPDENFEGA